MNLDWVSDVQRKEKMCRDGLKAMGRLVVALQKCYSRIAATPIVDAFSELDTLLRQRQVNY